MGSKHRGCGVSDQGQGRRALQYGSLRRMKQEGSGNDPSVLPLPVFQFFNVGSSREVRWVLSARSGASHIAPHLSYRASPLISCLSHLAPPLISCPTSHIVPRLSYRASPLISCPTSHILPHLSYPAPPLIMRFIFLIVHHLSCLYLLHRHVPRHSCAVFIGLATCTRCGARYERWGKI